MDPRNLQPGKVYFNCGYVHPKYPIPRVLPLVFIREGADGFWFQNPQKYFQKDILEDLSDEDKKEFLDSMDEEDIFIAKEEIHLIKEFVEFKSFVNELEKKPFFKKIY